MALAVDGRDVLSIPEFSELMSHLDGAAQLPAVVTAWWMGEAVSAADLVPALDVAVRIAARDDQAHALIDRALRRLGYPVMA